MSPWFSPWIMRRLHGDGPSGRICGECRNFKEFGEILEDEGLDSVDDDEGYCDSTGIPKTRHAVKFVVGREWLSCSLFKSHLQVEREFLEDLGQLRIWGKRRTEP